MGSIIVPIINQNRKVLPRNLNFAKPYAARASVKSTSTRLTMVMYAVFL